MREWRGVKLSIKIVCSAVEGQRIDRLRQFDGVGNPGWELGGELWDRYGPFLPFGTVGKESYMGGQKSSIYLVLAYAFI
jgi:hypothetical protein